MKQRNSFKFLIIIFAFIFVLSGCSLFPQKPTEPVSPPVNNNQDDQDNNQVSQTDQNQTIEEQLIAQKNINKFENLDELKNFIEERGTGSAYSGYGGMAVDDVMWGGVEKMAVNSMDLENVAVPTVQEATGLGGGPSDDFSTTNIQVEGVDEADIIKTDGKYVYAVVKNDLYIVDAYPAQDATVLAKIQFESRPQDIYINGEDGKTSDKLVVFGQDDVFYKTDIYQKFKRRGNYAFFKVFDITDKKNPKQIRDLDLEGNYSNSRMIGDYVYFITNNYNYYYAEDEPILPKIISNGEVVSNTCGDGAKCFMPDMYYFDMPYSSYNFTSVLSVNIKDENEEIGGDVYLMSSNQNMYVSLNNIYITYTRYISEYELEMQIIREILYPRLSEKDQDKIAKIEEVENFILSPDEKNRKIQMIIENYGYTLGGDEQDKLDKELEEAMKKKYEDISKELEKTIIHKIAINKGNLEYKTVGEVTGQVLNQFSMDEQDGYFRIATTKNRTWSRYMEENLESYSNVYVLDKDLKVVGAVEKLAPDERIYSARFMQDRVYLVTFKQMDPLFVIDLSSPTNPKVLGELKIPGFSNYLHPYDDTTLIGFGKDTGETEWGGVRTKGLKVSLFDVSDVKNPKEIDTYVMGDAGSDSIALSDHKAFLFSKEKNLLVIPVSIRESLGGGSWGSLTFSGAAVLSIDKNGIELKGKIDHSDGGKLSESDWWRGYNYYDNTVKRSLYIDDVLYTFSNQYLKMNKLSDLNLVKNLELKKNKTGSDDDFEIIN